MVKLKEEGRMKRTEGGREHGREKERATERIQLA